MNWWNTTETASSNDVTMVLGDFYLTEASTPEVMQEYLANVVAIPAQPAIYNTYLYYIASDNERDRCNSPEAQNQCQFINLATSYSQRHNQCTDISIK